MEMYPNTIEHARQKARNGHTAEAVALLQSSSQAGNADAAAELAIWLLRGDLVRRDVSCAREFLRKAMQLGHEEATLLEIALCGNGGGGSADWRTALALLRQAEQSWAWLRHELELIDQMGLDQHGYPSHLPAPELIDESLPLVRYRDFLTPAERKHLAGVAVHMLEPSTVFDPRTGRQVTNPIRNSDSAVIGPTDESLVIQAINRRIAKATGTRLDQGEPINVLRYGPGQEYKLHYDAINGTTNNRTKTILLYLNDGYTGGQTVFPSLQLTVTPRAGDAIVFDGLQPDGTINPLSRHAGLPIERGTKWLATRWIRVNAFDPWRAGREA